MIDLHYWTTPNGHKITMFLEEAGLDYRIVPVDISAGDQFKPEFLAIAPNNRIPAIVDHAPADGGEPVPLFESGAILLYLAEKPAALPKHLRTGPSFYHGSFSLRRGSARSRGQAVHFQWAAPEGLDYARNRYRREAERHYRVLDGHLAGREYLVGDDYTIADMSAWGWVDRAARVFKGNEQPLQAFPNVRSWFARIDTRPAVGRVRALGTAHAFKKEIDEEARRALFPSNYPPG